MKIIATNKYKTAQMCSPMACSIGKKLMECSEGLRNLQSSEPKPEYERMELQITMMANKLLYGDYGSNE